MERIKKNGGRFLCKCADGIWYVMNDEDARKKAIQGKILARCCLELDRFTDKSITHYTLRSSHSTSRKQMELIKIEGVVLGTTWYDV